MVGAAVGIQFLPPFYPGYAGRPAASSTAPNVPSCRDAGLRPPAWPGWSLPLLPLAFAKLGLLLLGRLILGFGAASLLTGNLSFRGWAW